VNELDRIRLREERRAERSDDSAILDVLNAILEEQQAARHALARPPAAQFTTFALNPFQSVVSAVSTEIHLVGPIAVPFAVTNVAMLSAEERDAPSTFVRPAVRLSIAPDADTTSMNGFMLFGQYRPSADDNIYLSPGMVFSTPMWAPTDLPGQYIKARVQNLQADDIAVSILVAVELHPEWGA
jgi:hypothetical protein